MRPENGLESPASVATLQEAAERQLIQAGVVTNFVARGQAGGFLIEAAMGSNGTRFAVPGKTRKGLRIFASVTTIAMLLRRLGFDRFAVDAPQFEPGRARAARPNRAAAMKSVEVHKGGSSGKDGAGK